MDKGTKPAATACAEPVEEPPSAYEEVSWKQVSPALITAQGSKEGRRGGEIAQLGLKEGYRPSDPLQPTGINPGRQRRTIQHCLYYYVLETPSQLLRKRAGTYLQL